MGALFLWFLCKSRFFPQKHDAFVVELAYRNTGEQDSEPRTEGRALARQPEQLPTFGAPWIYTPGTRCAYKRARAATESVRTLSARAERGFTPKSKILLKT